MITALVLVGGLAVVFSPLLLEVRVALSVAGAVLSGAMMEASGRAEPPELVTAWQPPVAPWQSPVPQEPPASGEPPGSVPVAALRTEPVQVAKVDDALDSVGADSLAIETTNLTGVGFWVAVIGGVVTALGAITELTTRRAASCGTPYRAS